MSMRQHAALPMHIHEHMPAWSRVDNMRLGLHASRVDLMIGVGAQDGALDVGDAHLVVDVSQRGCTHAGMRCTHAGSARRHGALPAARPHSSLVPRAQHLIVTQVARLARTTPQYLSLHLHVCHSCPPCLPPCLAPGFSRRVAQKTHTESALRAS